MADLPQGFFLDTPRGPLLALYHPPSGQPRGLVLHLHPLAEELNNSRRTAAQQARAMARAGYAVLQFDMWGCGDSAGDFQDATWSAWLADAQDACHWLQAQHPGDGPLWLWGVRTGALLAGDLLKTWQQQPHTAPSGLVHLLLWQAVGQGRQALQHWSRLRALSQRVGQPTTEPAPSAPRSPAPAAAWTVAGYTFGTALQSGLAASTLSPVPAQGPQRLVWLEVVTTAPPQPSPAGTQALEAWRNHGWTANGRAVPGPFYWQTIGTDDAPDLVETTLAHMHHGH